MKKKSLLVSLICLAAQLLACGIRLNTSATSVYPPDTFQEEDLIGTWDNPFYHTETDEKLVLEDDHTFSHYVVFLDSDKDYESEGTWWVEFHTSGCAYLHLEGMVNYYQGIETALSGNRYSNGNPIEYWDRCEEDRTEMLDKVILIIGTDLDFVNGISLEYMGFVPDSTRYTLQLTDLSVE